MAGGANDERRPSAQPDAPNRVRLVGTFAIKRGSGVLEGAALGSRKARTLVKLLAVRRGDLVSLDTIVDVLWGTLRRPRQRRTSRRWSAGCARCWVET